jgi:hypothetical protein
MFKITHKFVNFFAIDLISKYFSIFLLIFDNAATNFIAPIYSFAFAIAIVEFYP